MKRAHEVTSVKWSNMAPGALINYLRATMNQTGIATRARLSVNDHKLRITIRVEVVDE